MTIKIAVLGAGFCGVAVAYHLLQRCPDIQVTLFDPNGVGGGASGIASGLMHPYAGARARQSDHAAQGMEATSKLIKVAEEALGVPVAKNSGLLRLAITPEQKHYFSECAAKHPDVQWWTEEQCKAAVPGIADAAGIWIPSAITVDAPLYLQGLWKACEKAGARLEKVGISSLREVEHFNAVVVALGGSICSLPEFSSLPLSFLKGQILELAWQGESLPFPINSQAYLVMGNEGRCLAGGTYERQFQDAKPDIARALAELTPKVRDLLPQLTHLDVVSCRAGLRAYTKEHRPWIHQFKKKSWIITGMGSKGLLYHALFAERLSSLILDSN